MPFDANADLHEELKNREQVEDQLAGLDKENKDQISALPQPEMAQAPVVPLEEAFQEASTPPQIAINSVQSNDKYVVDEQIQIPVDLSGAPKDRLSITYTAENLENENYSDDSADQIDLDESGRAAHSWGFKSEVEGSYLVRVNIANGKGFSMTQEVLVQVVAPEGTPVQESLAKDSPPSEGQAADQQMTFAT